MRSKIVHHNKTGEGKNVSTISVLVPIYFKENINTIKKCLRSMLYQTVTPNEIVCALDEPSTLEIEKIIDAFAKKIM